MCTINRLDIFCSGSILRSASSEQNLYEVTLTREHTLTKLAFLVSLFWTMLQALRKKLYQRDSNALHSPWLSMKTFALYVYDHWCTSCVVLSDPCPCLFLCTAAWTVTVWAWGATGQPTRSGAVLLKRKVQFRPWEERQRHSVLTQGTPSVLGELYNRTQLDVSGLVLQRDEE
jgi:hypothetical protein